MSYLTDLSNFKEVEMKPRVVTLKDIARELNLSTSTVSRALRDSYEISEKTKKKVLEYAKKHNYSPNQAALNLRTKQTRSIGVIIPTIANSFFSEVIDGIESIAFEKGYNVIITQTHESVKKEIDNIQYLYSRSIDGLLISLSAETNDITHHKEIHKQGVPIVYFDRIAEEIDTHKVIVDNEAGAYKATMHLINSGFTRIAHLANVKYLSITKARLGGYKKAMKEAGLPIPDHYIQFCPHGGLLQEEIETAIDNLLSSEEKPEAVFSVGGKLTSGCLRALKYRDIHVPEDMAMIGFSNSELFDLFSPPLTVVRQPALEMGKVSTEMLLDLIERKRPISEYKKVTLPTTMTIRDSTKLESKQ